MPDDTIKYKYLDSIAWEMRRTKAETAVIYSNIGSIYDRKRIFGTAYEYYTKAINLNDSLGNKPELAVNYGNLASHF